MCLQREHALSSDSDKSSESDSVNKSPLEQVFEMGRINRTLSGYHGVALNPTDKYLLKGFYTADKRELMPQTDDIAKWFKSKEKVSIVTKENISKGSKNTSNCIQKCAPSTKMGGRASRAPPFLTSWHIF